MPKRTPQYKYQIPHLFFAAFSALLDDLLSLGVNLLVVNLPCRLAALLALRRFGLHAHSRGTSAANLLLGIVPSRGSVVNFVSED